MPRERPLAPPRPRIPHLHHLILRPRDNSKCVPSERPYALDMAEESLKAATGANVPEFDGRVQRAGEHVPRRQRAVGRAPRRESRAERIPQRSRGRAFRRRRRRGRRIINRGDGVIKLRFVIRWQREDLLDLPHMPFKRLNTRLTIQIPQLHTTVIRRRKDGSGSRIDFDVVNPVAMPLKGECGFIAEIPDLDGFIDGPGREEVAVKVQRHDTPGVALVGGHALPRAPVPYFERAVQGAADEFRVVELQGADARGVAAKGAEFLACVDVPDLDGGVVRPRREDAVVELQTHDAVGVAAEDFGGAPPVFPVCADFEAVFVDFFPGPEARRARPGYDAIVGLGGAQFLDLCGRDVALVREGRGCRSFPPILRRAQL
ncbi:hypothetical protein V500_10703 [Pseudogymnoascus sp. VKM F-4518 (FW-2643)]|nr:hypothetical protein V500_10703 [Pseudogymnoascus sp. VKM F-4518 (FW-2643)]